MIYANKELSEIISSLARIGHAVDNAAGRAAFLGNHGELEMLRIVDKGIAKLIFEVEQFKKTLDGYNEYKGGKAKQEI